MQQAMADILKSDVIAHAVGYLPSEGKRAPC